MTIYLYKKTHNITGLNYLGKTANPNPYKYKGSGKYWLAHIQVHGYDVTTTILKECKTNDEVKYWGKYYSELWNVVDGKDLKGNKIWANLAPEEGTGGATQFGPNPNKARPGRSNGMYGKTHTKTVKEKLSAKAIKKFKGKTYEEIYGIKKAAELKKLKSKSLKGKNNSFNNNPRFDHTEYCFFNVKTGEIISCTRWVLIHYYRVPPAAAVDIINKCKTVNDWCLLHT
jgi:hypothetical protein